MLVHHNGHRPACSAHTNYVTYYQMRSLAGDSNHARGYALHQSQFGAAVSHPLPPIIEATETTLIDDSWFITLAQRKRQLTRATNHTAPLVIAVFGSAMTKPEMRDWIHAEALGAQLAKAGAIVISGGFGGIMEAVSKGAKEAGGITVGITCNDLPERKANPYVMHEWRTERWDQRLLALVWLADGYVVMPGSSGTLVELSMSIETQLKGFIPIRPLVCFGAFWKPVVKRIIGTSRIVTFASTAKAAARLAVGAPVPTRIKRRHKVARS